MSLRRSGSLLGVLCLLAVSVTGQNPQYPNYPSETPNDFKPTYAGFDYERRDVMIPMRDGVKLHTVILLPKGARNAPILMTRTPYNATALTTHAVSSHLGPTLHYDNSLFGV